MNTLWTPEQAWSWYNAQSWICGYNGYPSNCVNRIAMWQEYGHEEVMEQLKFEFSLARETGLNAVRAIIQFEVWLYQHDSFLKNLEDYLALADSFGVKVMLTLGNDCTVPKALYTPVKFGPQNVDWGWHSGIRRGPHAGGHTGAGYMLADEPEYQPKFFQMVEELAARYAKDPRIQIWDVWNEIGNSSRREMSLPMMERCFEILRAHDPIQPLTADVWSYNENMEVTDPVQIRALELSDVITFHCYAPLEKMVQVIRNLKAYGRPLINNEWLNRIEQNNVQEMIPLFWLEGIGSYFWGLIQGYSQTYEPWGCYFDDIKNPDYHGPNDYTKPQHDLYRFNGLPYDAKEVATIRKFTKLK